MNKDKVVIKQVDNIVVVKFMRDGKTVESFDGAIHSLKLRTLRSYCVRMHKEYDFKYIKVHTLCNSKFAKKIVKQINKSGLQIIELKDKQINNTSRRIT